MQTAGVSLPSEVAVVGAGTMGAGMAAVFALGGCRVRLCARRRETLERAAGRLEAIAGDASDRVSATTSLEEALAGADLVVETIVEAIDEKRAVLALAESAAPEAILTSNTSSLSLTEIAEPLRRPERFAGLHWLNPPELVELVEVVGTEATEPAILETLRDWMSELGKAPVVVRRDLPGFLVNRLQYALLREAWALVEDGVCSLEDLDRVLTHGLGARWAAVGPIRTMDLGGLDVFLAVGRNLLPELSTAKEPPAFLADAVSAGALGCKNGRGLFGAYSPEDLAALTALRERVLTGLRRLREGQPADD